MKRVEKNIWQDKKAGKSQYYYGVPGDFKGPYDSIGEAKGNIVETTATLYPNKEIKGETENEEDNKDSTRSEEQEG